MNQPLHLYVLGYVDTKRTQKASQEVKLFETFEEVRGYGWYRLSSIDTQLIMNLNKP